MFNNNWSECETIFSTLADNHIRHQASLVIAYGHINLPLRKINMTLCNHQADTRMEIKAKSKPNSMLQNWF